MQSDSTIPDENLDAAIKFGVERIDATDTRKYVVAFMRKLLLQREKLENKVMENHLELEIVKQWWEVLSTLENKDRKLINIQSGSLVFTLLCPTRESRVQLQDDTWKDEIQKKIVELAKLLGTFYLLRWKKCVHYNYFSVTFSPYS